MKSNHPKLKPPPRPLFSCSFFRHCTAQTSLSPTTPTPPPLPPSPPPHAPPHPPPPPPTKKLSSSSSSSSSSTSQSFTQWKFPLPTSPPPQPTPQPRPPPTPPPPPFPLSSSPTNNDNLLEIFRTAELHLTSSNAQTQLSALHLLERNLLGDQDQLSATCPPSLMRAIVAFLRTNAAPQVRKSATKILLSLCLAEPNRRVAVEAGAAGAVVEGAMEMAEEGGAAERALAALELMCTVEEGAEEVRTHALAVPAMVGVMGRVEGRGREHAMGVLAVVFGGGRKGEEGGGEVAEEVAKAVELALKGECSERGRRKGKQLLKILAELPGQKGTT